jgi:hydrogenase expression/formation protein HypE
MTLNDIALSSEVCIALEESQIPVRDQGRGACEILGLDLLYVANAGKLVGAGQLSERI